MLHHLVTAVWFALIVLIIENHSEDYWYNDPSHRRIDNWPYTEKLLSHENNDPREFCEGYICEYSGLTTLDKKWSYWKENTERSTYAKLKTETTNGYSNIYLLNWDKYVARYAQDKANLCLPETDSETVIHDSNPISQKWNENSEQYSSSDTCEFQSNVFTYYKTQWGKSFSISPATRIFKSSIDLHSAIQETQYFPNGTKLTRKFLRGAGSYGMGCGFIFRQNFTHYISHIVCYICPAVNILHHKEYRPKPGNSCAECKEHFYAKKVECSSDVPIPAGIPNLMIDSLCFVRDFASEFEDADNGAQFQFCDTGPSIVYKNG